MKVYNEEKTEVLETYDLTKGFLRTDKILKVHHESVPAAPAVAVASKIEAILTNGGKVIEIDGVYYEVVKEFQNGGMTVEEIEETPGVPKQEAYDEYEEIFVFVPYTEEELEKQNPDKYENRVVELLREKYSLNQELAILRQRDAKPEEYAAYNEYAEACKTKAKIELNIQTVGKE